MSDSLPSQARLFAHAAHGAANNILDPFSIPVIDHVIEIAGILCRQSVSETTLAIGWLSQVLLRTPITPTLLGKHFPDDVIDGLESLNQPPKSEYPDRSSRMSAYRIKLQMARDEAKTVKLAEIIATTSLYGKRHPEWEMSYYRSQLENMELLKGGNKKLIKRAKTLLQVGLNL